MEVKYKHKEGVTVGYRDGQLATIDSREVADMLGKEHKALLKDINGGGNTIGLIPTLIGANFEPNKYFIESSYMDSRNREQKCYRVTKMGCELLGNKQQGEKGILFTAKYVEAFNKMEEHIKGQAKPLSAMEQLKLQYQVLGEHEEKLNKIDGKIDDLENNLPLFNVECKELQGLVRKKGVEVLGGKGSQAYKDNSLRGKVYADIQHELKREFQVTRYEAIKRCQLIKAREIIANYKIPFMLKDEIIKVNNQMDFEEVI